MSGRRPRPKFTPQVFAWTWLKTPSAGIAHQWRWDAGRRMAISMCGQWLSRTHGKCSPDDLTVPVVAIEGIPATACKQCLRISRLKGVTA